jgi:hypothetical protein
MLKLKTKLFAVRGKAKELPERFPDYYRITYDKNMGWNTGITCSMLYTFLKCRQNFLLTTHGYETTKVSPGMLYGSLFHNYLDVVYSNNSFLTEKEIRNTMLDYIDNDKKFERIESQERDRIYSLSKIMAKYYQIFYKDDFKTGKFYDTEKVFDNIIEDYRLRGKIDSKQKVKGLKYLWEHKNYWQINEENFKDLLHNNLQNLFYIFNDEYDTGEDFAGVKYNMVRVPQNKFTTETEFKEKVEDSVKKDMKHYFLRYNVEYSKQEKMKFKISILKILKEVDDLINGKLEIYKNYGACEGKFLCPFITACSNCSLALYHKKEKLFSELIEEGK